MINVLITDSRTLHLYSDSGYIAYICFVVMSDFLCIMNFLAGEKSYKMCRSISHFL
jgi:hypothetical protein